VGLHPAMHDERLFVGERRRGAEDARIARGGAALLDVGDPVGRPEPGESVWYARERARGLGVGILGAVVVACHPRQVISRATRRAPIDAPRVTAALSEPGSWSPRSGSC